MRWSCFLSLCSLPLAKSGASRYWLNADGSPRPVTASDSALREQYLSAKSRRLPKAFTLEPSECRYEGSASATAAFAARYDYGWTQSETGGKKFQLVNGEGLFDATRQRAARAAVRTFDPSYYYSDPLNRASASGWGSSINNQSRTDREWLVGLIRAHNITSLIDVPCGDANWQFGDYETDALEAYVGLDIVPRVVELNSARFAHHSNKRFAAWDFAECPLPKVVWPGEQPAAADAVHARHVFNHMPTMRALAAVRHMIASGARFILCSGVASGTALPAAKRRGESAVSPNTDIREGHMRQPWMGEAPFFFPRPVSCSKFMMCAYEFDEATRRQWMERQSNHTATTGTTG